MVSMVFVLGHKNAIEERKKKEKNISQAIIIVCMCVCAVNFSEHITGFLQLRCNEIEL